MKEAERSSDEEETAEKKNRVSINLVGASTKGSGSSSTPEKSPPHPSQTATGVKLSHQHHSRDEVIATGMETTRTVPGRKMLYVTPAGLKQDDDSEERSQQDVGTTKVLSAPNSPPTKQTKEKVSEGRTGLKASADEAGGGEIPDWWCHNSNVHNTDNEEGTLKKKDGDKFVPSANDEQFERAARRMTMMTTNKNIARAPVDDEDNKETKMRRLLLEKERHGRKRRRKAVPFTFDTMEDDTGPANVHNNEDLEEEDPNLFHGEETPMSPQALIEDIRPGAVFVRGIDEGTPSGTAEGIQRHGRHDMPAFEHQALNEGAETAFSAFVVGEETPPETHDNEAISELNERIRRIILANAPVVEGVLADVNDGESSWKSYFRRNPALSAFLAIVVIATVIIGSTLGGIYGSRSKKSSPSSPSTQTYQPPSSPPTEDPLVRFQSIWSLLVSDGVSTSEALGDPSSPQRRALNWVAYNDSRQVSWQEDVQHLIQRYVLATFFFATGGGDGFWNKTYGFLTETHECNWWTIAKPNKYYETEGSFCSGGQVSGIVDAIFTLFNNLTGTLPDELHKLSNIRILGIFGNPLLRGTIPPVFSKLTSLADGLVLTENQLSGTIPEELGELTDIQGMYLHTNNLTGTVPSSFGKLTSIHVLELAANMLSGPLPVELGELTELQVLHLFSNNLTGTIPSSFGKLTSMTQLAIYSNSLIGPLPVEFGELTELQILSLHSNNLNGTIPSSFGKLTSMKKLHVYSNMLSGPLPETLGDLAELEELYLYFNNLPGTIPTSFGKLTSMTDLELGYNMLSGPLPAELGDLTKLEFLYLHSNKFNGTIPSSLGKLTSMFAYSVHSNMLYGSLPTELGEMAELQLLYLYSNRLTGTIPTSFGKLTSTRKLDIGSNKLTGTIPKALGQLTNLDFLYLIQNSLSGSVPSEVCDLRTGFLDDLWVDCAKGEVQCTCCTACCGDTSNGGSQCCMVSNPSNCVCYDADGESQLSC